MVEEAEKVLAAARDGDIRTLQSFRRSVPFATDSFGATALHHATRYGKLECVRWMVEKVGIKAKVKAKNGATPLHDACTQGKLLCVKFYIQECQMNPDATDNAGHTPLHLAARFGYVDILKWMINKAKCNPRLKTMNRMNAIHFAAAGGHLSCLEFLISSGNTILVDERATDGTTPTFIATQNGHFPCLKYLHTVGAKCDLRSRDGMHLIHAAAQNGHLDCIGYLVVNSLASETEGDSTGATPAHYASGEGHVPVLKWLSKRCDLSIKDQLGGTPLHDASEKGQLAAIQFLVESCHLNTKLKDNSGLTPIELAEKYGHKRCHDYLREASLKANQLRAAKMMSFTNTFDKQSVKDNSGSSFLHVLKKKPRQMERPPSPQSAKAPDLPPLDLTPEPSPRSSPIPCMIEFGKASEWRRFNDENVAETLPHTAEVDRSVEDQSRQREHLLDSNGMQLLAPLNDEFWKKKNRNSTPTRNVDAYTQNDEDARNFDDHPIEHVTDEMLEAAKMRTNIMNSRLQNPTPSPLHIFDERSEETEARKKEDFSYQIQTARSKRSPHNTLSKSDYELSKPLKTENENIENENIEERGLEEEALMEFSGTEKAPFEDQMLNCSAVPSPKSAPLNPSPQDPKTLTDIFANSARGSTTESEKKPTQNSRPCHITSSTPQPKRNDTTRRESAQPEENLSSPSSSAPKGNCKPAPRPNQVKSPPPLQLSPQQKKDNLSTPSEQVDNVPQLAPQQTEEKPSPSPKLEDDKVPFEPQGVEEKQADDQRSPEVEQARRNPPKLNSNLYTPTPLVQLSKKIPASDDHKQSTTETNEPLIEEHEPKTDENEQPIDEENYMTTDEESEKTASLPRPEKMVEEKVPLRQRQLQPLPHMTGMSAAKKSIEEAIDQQTWATLPEWKRQVLRNRIMKEQQAELELRKQEEETRQKYAGVPAWKVPIMQREESDRKNREEELAHLPEWKKQLILRKRTKLMS